MEHRTDLRNTSTVLCICTILISGAFQRQSRRRCLTLRKLLELQLFIPQVFHAIAKPCNAKPTKGETTGMGTCKDVSERGGRLLRSPFPVSEIRLAGSPATSACRTIRRLLIIDINFDNAVDTMPRRSGCAAVFVSSAKPGLVI